MRHKLQFKSQAISTPANQCKSEDDAETAKHKCRNSPWDNLESGRRRSYWRMDPAAVCARSMPGAGRKQQTRRRTDLIRGPAASGPCHRSQRAAGFRFEVVATHSPLPAAWQLPSRRALPRLRGSALFGRTSYYCRGDEVLVQDYWWCTACTSRWEERGFYTVGASSGQLATTCRMLMIVIIISVEICQYKWHQEGTSNEMMNFGNSAGGHCMLLPLPLFWLTAWFALSCQANPFSLCDTPGALHSMTRNKIFRWPKTRTQTAVLVTSETPVWIVYSNLKIMSRINIVWRKEYCKKKKDIYKNFTNTSLHATSLLWAAAALTQACRAEATSSATGSLWVM